MSSIKQVLPTIKNKFVGAIHESPTKNLAKIKRAIRESPLRKRTENMKILCPFLHILLARYSVLHFSGELSGGNEPSPVGEGGPR